MQQTFQFNLENGTVGSGPGADLWFEAVSQFQLFLTPVNGAQIAVGDKSDRGYDGCSDENFSRRQDAADYTFRRAATSAS